jgi:hypothetical protein
MMKFVARPFADPAAAAQKLVEITQELVWPQGYAYTGVTNTAFTRAGGSVAEYGAGVKYGIAQGLFTIDESGTRISVTQAPATL